MTNIYSPRAELFTHARPRAAAVDALAELAMLDAVRHGVLVAQMRRDKTDGPGWLDRIENQLKERRGVIVRRLEGTGVLYVEIGGHVIAAPFEGAKGAA